MIEIQEDYRQLARAFPEAYIDRSGKLLLIENHNRFAIVVNRSWGGYQAHAEIEPNTRTGSSVGLTGDYWDSVDLNKLRHIIANYSGGLPSNVYSEADLATIRFRSIKQAVESHGNILGYTKIVS